MRLTQLTSTLLAPSGCEPPLVGKIPAELVFFRGRNPKVMPLSTTF